MPNTTIQLKKSSTPSSVPADLANGELAINFADGKLFYKNAAGFIVEFNPTTSSYYFGTVNANSTLLVADTTSDVLTMVPGNNITIVGDAVNDKVTIGLSNDVNIPGKLNVAGDFNHTGGNFYINNASGAGGTDEGGEIRLANATTNQVLSGPISIDIYQNKLRFFETNSPNRGAYINLASAAAGAGTDLLATGNSAVDSVARSTASEAFDKANNALANTDGITFGGTLNVSKNLSADKIISLNNGLGENFKVGDDAWLGDTNLADTVRLKGQQNANNGYIMFGPNDGTLLGRQGTNNLTYGGNTVWHAGNDGTGSGLDADFLDGQHGSYYTTIASSAYDKANSANILAFNTGVGANAFSAATIAGANTAVGAGANAYANLVWSRSNTYASSVGTAANAFASSTIAGANTAVGAGANAFTSETIAGANTAVGAGANNYANSTFVKLTATDQTITGNVNIVGDLTLSGNTIIIEATRLQVDDPLIYLAGNNYASDIVDIGFIANYVNATGSNVHTGLYREHTDKMYYLFQGYDKEPINNHIGALSNNMTLAVLNADLRTSNLELGGINAIPWITAAFDKANVALPNTSGISFNGNLAFPTGNVVIGRTDNSVDNNIKLDVNGAINASAVLVNGSPITGGAYYQGNNGDVGSVSGLGDIFRVHTNILNANVTIYSGNNALAAGPITVNVGKTLTIQTNARVSIV